MPFSIAFVPAALAAALLAQEPPAAAPPPPRDPRNVPTVNLDPEHPFPIEGWWSNGSQLLEVAPEGTYRLYATQNRYAKPTEVGRWHRQNHAAFWLSPYSLRKEERSRVPLAITDGTLVITVRTLKPMRMLESPPACAEDLFIGLWSGAGGQLDLSPTMRYRYTAPRGPSPEQPVVISSHKGLWRVVDGVVELLPDSPSVAKLRFEPTAAQPGRLFTQLRGVEGALDRIAELAPGTPGAPPSVPPESQTPAAAPEPAVKPRDQP